MNAPNIEKQTPEGNRPADRAKPTLDLMSAAIAVLDRDLGMGLVTREQVNTRLTRDARKTTALLLAQQGLSTRQIAQITGGSQRQIARDISEPNGSKSEPNGSHENGAGKPKQKPATSAKFVDDDWSGDEESGIEAEIEPDNRRLAFLLRADQAKQFSVYSGPIDEEIVEAARAAALAWNDLAHKLEREIPDEDDALDIPDYLKRGAR